MYFIVGKCINQNGQIISYLITDGNDVQKVSPQQVYVEYQKGNLPYLKGFNTNNVEVDFKNIDNTLIPTFCNGRGINNSVSVLRILTDKGNQIGVRLLLPSNKIKNIRLSELLYYINNDNILLFNAKIVNNKVVMKYAETIVTESNSGNKEEVTINNYDKSKFLIEYSKLRKYRGNDKKVIIPKGVTEIGNCAFIDCTNLTNIIIPDSVTSIEEYAFEGCTSLTSITIPNSVTSIGEYAFWGCERLTSITIPNSVISIGDCVFRGCTGLTSIVIPDNLTHIADGVFWDCESLTNVVIPDSVTSIGSYAFCNCKMLKSIVIPDSVTSIGYHAFHDTAWYNSQPDGVVYSGKGVVCSYKGVMHSGTEIVLKKGTTGIADGAFEGCTGLISIVIPDSVTSIGSYAFEGCTGLISIVIPDSVKSIGSYAFEGCTGLISIVIPDSVTSIGYRAFWGCERLTSITIPNSVTSIGDGAFNGCTGLTSIIITDSVIYIGKKAFDRCDNLTIYGNNFSARKYAQEYNIPFIEAFIED